MGRHLRLQRRRNKTEMRYLHIHNLQTNQCMLWIYKIESLLMAIFRVIWNRLAA